MMCSFAYDDEEGHGIEWETSEMPIFSYDRGRTTKDVMRGMAVVREHNAKTIWPLLDQLSQFDFFSLFSLNLMGFCAYMPTHEEGCEIGVCDVEPARKVPGAMRQRDLDETDFNLDGWARKDMTSDFTEYFDLREHPDANTGYDGSRVWRFIHQKICFQKDLHLLENGWKRDFNRAVSGMHAAVSAQILADIGLNEEGLQQYHRRLRDQPGAIANLYFFYMLTLCAIHDCRKRIECCSYLGEGDGVLPLMKQLTRSELIQHEAVQAAARNVKDHTEYYGMQGRLVWRARLRMRDLVQIMDCVQCNLCRLHGKVMCLGLGATLQVLLGSDGRGGDPLALDRVQVGALVATCIKLGKACATVEAFRELDGDDMTKAFGEPSDRPSGPQPLLYEQYLLDRRAKGGM